MTVQVRDDFSAAGTLAGATPDTTNIPGDTWNNVEGVMTKVGGVLTGTSTTANDWAQIDCGFADGLAKVEMSDGALNVVAMGVNCNYTDPDTFWHCVSQSSSAQIYQVTNGSFQLRANGTSYNTQIGGLPVIIEATMAGDTISVKGTSGAEVSDASYTVGSRVGKTSVDHGPVIFRGASFSTELSYFEFDDGAVPPAGIIPQIMHHRRQMRH